MSRLKFRVWDDDSKKYLENPAIAMHFDLEGNLKVPKQFEGRLFIEQCANTEDENNKLIFGGDLVRDEDCKEYLVDFRYGAWCLIHEPTCGSEREGECKWDYIHDFNKIYDIEIIGTTHDEVKK